MNVYFSQFCLEMPDGMDKEYLFFPYSVGCIWAYANTHSEVQENLKLKEFFVRKEDPEQIVASLDNPKLFGFSSYVWNINFNLHLAKLVKKKYPDCIIFFGGPSVPLHDENWLKQNTFIDYALYREGELVFYELCKRILGMEHSTEGMGFLVNGKLNEQNTPKRIKDLSQMPSPYTAGYFDDLIAKYKGTNVYLNAIFETNRGCPFGCTYCDWGNGGLGKVKKFSLCRVQEELEWAGKNKVDYIWGADANFGAFKQRDLEIAKMIVDVNKRYGFPRTFYTNWHKNQSRGLVDIAMILLESGVMRNFNASLQTNTQPVLDAIKRKNVSNEVFGEMISLCHDKGYSMNTDLLLPLPLETVESFKDTLNFCYDLEIAPNSIPLTILVGSEMNDKTYREKYGLITQFGKFGNPNIVPWVSEVEEQVIGTNTMSTKEFEKLMLLSYVMQHLDLLGFTNLVARYYKKTESILLTDFYEKLLDYFLKNKSSTMHDHLSYFENHVEDKVTSNLVGGIYYLESIKKIGENQREKFFADLKDFCLNHLPENSNLNDLISLQYNWQNHSKNKSVIEVKYKSNLYDYIMDKETVLQKQQTTYKILMQGLPKKYKNFGEYILATRYLRTFKNKIIKVA